MADRPPPPRLDTLAVHAGRLDDPHGAVVTPVYRAATYRYPAGDRPLVYGRYGNNPAQRALHARLAALEGAEDALVTASGMAAIATTILATCGTGDRLVAPRDLYGGTLKLLEVELPRLGIGVDWADPADPATWEVAVGPRTRLFLWEAISNPLLRVPDPDALAEIARRRGVITVVDATFATPLNQRPIDHGVDLVVHSATKYLGGHADLVGGVVAGSAERVATVTERMHSFGGAPDPQAVFLLERGIKTLALRVERQNANGRAIAEHLAGHPKVARVHHPTRPDHPDRAVAERVLDGGGGVVAFVPRASPAEIERALGRLAWMQVAPSLGGVESLVSMPSRTSHRGLAPEARAALGIPDAMVRLALGIEAAADLAADLDRALAAL